MTAWVYRFWGYDGEPVYVGRTIDLKGRINNHGSHKARQCAKLDICKCADLAEADAIEQSEITRLRPRENRHHNPDCGYSAAEIIDHGKKFLEVPKGLGCFNLAAMDKTSPPWARSYYNWKRQGFKGFDPDTPLDEVEINDEEAGE